MGVTLTLTRKQLFGAAIFVALMLFLRWRRPSEEVADIATPENPLVLGSPELQVVSGPDTAVIRGPALFTYFGIEGDEGVPSRSAEEGAQALADAMVEAEPGLQEMGVRIFSVAEPPVPLGIAPEVDAAAGPRFVPGSLGLLFADPRGRVLRLDRIPNGSAVVCAAARTFARTPPPDFAAACR